MTTRQALWIVILASTLLRLVLAAGLGADTNEAYYYAYTRHPDWSYFDHPPMVALIVELGVTFAGFASTVLGIRAGFLVLFAASDVADGPAHDAILRPAGGRPGPRSR